MDHCSRRGAAIASLEHSQYSSYNLCGTSVFKSEILTLAVHVRETGLVLWEKKYITNIWELNATRNGSVEKGLKCDIQDSTVRSEVDCVWNVMVHAQKPDFVFRRNGRVHLNRQGRQFSRLLAPEVCAPAVVTLDTPSSEVVKGTGSPLHSPVSPSLPLPCVTVCYHVSTGLCFMIFCSLRRK